MDLSDQLDLTQFADWLDGEIPRDIDEGVVLDRDLCIWLVDELREITEDGEEIR